MPAYFVILACYFLLLPMREVPQMPPLWKFLLSVQNIGLQGDVAFSHSWSLAVEDQFYLVLPFVLLLVFRFRKAAAIVPCATVIGAIALRAIIASAHPAPNDGVSFSAFKELIYYPTWCRLDPLVFGVVLAALQRHRPRIWQRITDQAIWLWVVGFAAIALALNLDRTVASCATQFTLLGLGMAALLVCAVSPRLPFKRFRIPGAAFVASIAYSVYLSHKLVTHGAARVCNTMHIPLGSVLGHVFVQACIYATGAALFLIVERPFLQLRQRVAR